MTKAKWESSNEPSKMLKLLQGKATSRKLRLLVCGCCRLISDSMTATQLRQAVEVSERFADDNATELERAAAERELRAWDEWEANEQAYGCACGAVMVDVAKNAGPALDEVARALAFRAFKTIGPKWKKKFDSAQVQLASFVRDIFGNPFRPVAADSAWLTSDVVALSEGIYAEHAFDRLPILADALQDAGCDNEDVLNHCRSDGPHVKGCWLIDMLTGRK